MGKACEPDLLRHLQPGKRHLGLYLVLLFLISNLGTFLFVFVIRKFSELFLIIATRVNSLGSRVYD